MKTITLTACLNLLLVFSINAANITAVQNGNWLTATTWDLGRAPQDNDVVTIPASRQVNFAGAPYPKNAPTTRPTMNIRVYGILDFSNAGNDKLYLDAGSVVQIFSGGTIQTSTASSEIIAIYDGSTDNTVWTGTPSTVSGPAYATATSSGFSNGILPVKLHSFDIKKSGEGNALLKWTTSAEINSSAFEIEYKISSATNWKQTGRVQAAGYSSDLIEYSYAVTLETGVNLFRLKQIDKDGKYSYSPVVSMKYDGINNVLINYNPSTHQLTVNGLENNTGNVAIYDASGKSVYKTKITSSVVFIPKICGVYIFSVETGGSRYAQKICTLE